MASRSVAFDKVRSISPVAESWMIRVLLSRMWSVYDEFGDKDCIAVDMLLIDSDGAKIQAKVYKMHFTNFLDDMHEGGVYVIRNFNVVPNTGSNKVANHLFIIVFQRKTIVTRTDRDVLHTIGLSPLTTASTCDLQYSDEYVVDMIGLLTGVSTEKEYVCTGLGHRFITLELTDHPGKVEISLFDEYVDKFIEFLASSAHIRPAGPVQSHNGRSYRIPKKDCTPWTEKWRANKVADGQDTKHFVLLDDEIKYLVRKSYDALLDEVKLSMVSGQIIYRS
ncbi:Nucleic acid-binding, OB-fold [Sesbania bispinosa]|nr:Nucleic acid-binding, OB-fold [Sesbania bispinosa]